MMTERERVISKLQAEIDSAAYIGDSYKDCVPISVLQDAVNQLSDPDLVKVVRCRDCRFWEPLNAEEGDCSGVCNANGVICDMNWFCADGEREG